MQSGVSQQIAKLERGRDVVLLQRRPAGVTPTPAGRALYRKSVALLEAMARAELEAKASRATISICRSVFTFQSRRLDANRGRSLRIAIQSIDNGEVAYRAACGAAPELITPIADRKCSLAELENPPREEVSHPAANRFRSRGATSSAVGELLL